SARKPSACPPPSHRTGGEESANSASRRCRQLFPEPGPPRHSAPAAAARPNPAPGAQEAPRSQTHARRAPVTLRRTAAPVPAARPSAAARFRSGGAARPRTPDSVPDDAPERLAALPATPPPETPESGRVDTGGVASSLCLVLLAERFPGPMQPHLHLRQGQVQNLSDLRIAHRLPVAQPEDDALFWLHPGHRLPHGDALHDGTGAIRHGSLLVYGSAHAAAPAEAGGGLVHGDPIQPGLEAAVAPEIRQGAKGAGKGRLSRILRVVRAAQQTIAEGVYLRLVSVIQLFQRPPFAPPGGWKPMLFGALIHTQERP